MMKSLNEQRREALIAYAKMIEELWMIIDDIDSYGDVAKSDDKLYRALVERRHGDRWKLPISTDGYNIVIQHTTGE